MNDMILLLTSLCLTGGIITLNCSMYTHFTTGKGPRTTYCGALACFIFAGLAHFYFRYILRMPMAFSHEEYSSLHMKINMLIYVYGLIALICLNLWAMFGYPFSKASLPPSCARLAKNAIVEPLKEIAKSLKESKKKQDHE